MNADTANKLVKGVLSIHNKDGKNVPFKELKLVKHSSKYSNTKIQLYKIQLDGKILPRSTPYKVTYKCIVCSVVTTFNLGNLRRKANEGKLRCYRCKEMDISKRQKQSEFMTKTYKDNGKVKPKIKLVIVNDGKYKMHTSNFEFEKTSVDFKHKYFERHMTLPEFENIRTKIISVQNGKYDITNFIYCPHIIVHNQTKFNPSLYDPNTSTYIKPSYITYICEICNELFTNRDLYTQKGRTKLMCNNCNLCNNVYKVRPMENIVGTRITYQSKMELKFVLFCEQNGIVVENGPNLKYHWNGNTHTYRVDFFIPVLNALVEIKADHCWHREQVENGKWQAKLDAVTASVKKKIHSMYFLIFPKNYEENIAYILDKI